MVMVKAARAIDVTPPPQNDAFLATWPITWLPSTPGSFSLILIRKEDGKDYQEEHGSLLGKGLATLGHFSESFTSVIRLSRKS